SQTPRHHTLAALLHLCSTTTTLSDHLFGHLFLSLSPISSSSRSSSSTLSSTLPPPCPICSFPLPFLA
ncbi:hypothetical protein Droror1_Dr00016399, partial [Drosera rotundifolia]